MPNIAKKIKRKSIYLGAYGWHTIRKYLQYTFLGIGLDTLMHQQSRPCFLILKRWCIVIFIYVQVSWLYHTDLDLVGGDFFLSSRGCQPARTCWGWGTPDYPTALYVCAVAPRVAGEPHNSIHPSSPLCVISKIDLEKVPKQNQSCEVYEYLRSIGTLDAVFSIIIRREQTVVGF